MRASILLIALAVWGAWCPRPADAQETFTATVSCTEMRFPGDRPSCLTAPAYTKQGADTAIEAVRSALAVKDTELSKDIEGLRGSLATHQAEIGAHKMEVTERLKAIVTPELVAAIEKALVPKVRAAVIADLRQQGLLKEGQ